MADEQAVEVLRSLAHRGITATAVRRRNGWTFTTSETADGPFVTEEALALVDTAALTASVERYLASSDN